MLFFLFMSGKMCIFATSNTPKSARVRVGDRTYR